MDLPAPHVLTFRRGRDGSYSAPHVVAREARGRALTRMARVSGVASVGAAFGRGFGEAKAARSSDAAAIWSGMQAAAVPAVLGGIPHAHQALEAGARGSVSVFRAAVADRREGMAFASVVAAAGFKTAAVAARYAAPVVAPIMAIWGGYEGYKSGGARGAVRGAIRAVDPTELATIAGAKSGLGAKALDAAWSVPAPPPVKKWWQVSDAKDPALRLTPDERTAEAKAKDEAFGKSVARQMSYLPEIDRLGTYTPGKREAKFEDRRGEPPVWSSPIRDKISERRAHIDHYGLDVHDIELNVGASRRLWLSGSTPAARAYTGELNESLRQYNMTRGAFERRPERQAQGLKSVSDLVRGGLEHAPAIKGSATSPAAMRFAEANAHYEASHMEPSGSARLRGFAVPHIQAAAQRALGHQYHGAD